MKFNRPFQETDKLMFKKTFTFLALVVLTLTSFSQDTSAVVSEIDKELNSKRKTVSDILTESTFLYLHPLTSFRETIKKYADAGDITIVTETEPGVRVTVNAAVTDSSGKPLAGILVYFYHTSDKGWYSDTGVHILKFEGDHRHSRLFGYVKTDSNGRFSINTIRPNGYPKSDFAAHIHIQMWNDDGTYLLGIPGELQFDDDVRMTERRRQRSLSEGFLIAKNEGTAEKPIYNYLIKSNGN